MRQSMAEAIIFAGFYCLRREDYKKFMMYVLIASLFHYSALLAVVSIMCVYWFTIKVNSSLHAGRGVSWIPYVIIIAMFFLQNLILSVVESMSFLPPQYSLMFMQIGNTQEFRANIFQNIAVIIMLFVYGKNASRLFPAKQDEYYKINALLACAMYSTIGGYTIWRLLDYLDYINLYALASLHRLVKDKYLRAIFLAVTISVVVLYWYREYLLAKSALGFPAHQTWPYHSIFS